MDTIPRERRDQTKMWVTPKVMHSRGEGTEVTANCGATRKQTAIKSGGRCNLLMILLALSLGACSAGTLTPTLLAAGATPTGAAVTVGSADPSAPQPSKAQASPSTVPHVLEALADVALPSDFVPSSWALDADGLLWLSAPRNDRAGSIGLIAIDPKSGVIRTQSNLSGETLLAGSDFWIGDEKGVATLSSGKISNAIPLPAAAPGSYTYAMGLGHIWASGAGQLYGIDTTAKKVVSKWSIPGRVVADCGGLAMVDDSDGAKTTIRWIDPTKGSILGTIAVDGKLALGPTALGSRCVVVTAGPGGQVGIIGTDRALGMASLDMSNRNAVVANAQLYTYQTDGLLTPVDSQTGDAGGAQVQLPGSVSGNHWQLVSLGGQLWAFTNLESQDTPVHAVHIATAA
jgi:hypothetical protein